MIGLRGTPGHGSLREWGVAYRELPLAEDNDIDWEALSTAITPSKSSAVSFGLCSSRTGPPLSSIESISCIEIFRLRAMLV